MTVKAVVKMGYPSLWQRSEAVSEFNTNSLRDIVQNMFDTMKLENGVGIAAPQIGIQQRIILFGFDSNSRYPNAKSIPTTVLINPELNNLSDEMEEGFEGCLSVPGLRGLVPRYKHIHYAGYDIEGNKIEGEAKSFHARILQHECDHLEGILYLQRIQNWQKFGFEADIGPAIQEFYS
ncbi:MAG: peptide deformylase [Gammaproteobacteria bacterium]|nr:peptide deformylase [Gammaproteobacteria bacterium]